MFISLNVKSVVIFIDLELKDWKISFYKFLIICTENTLKIFVSVCIDTNSILHTLYYSIGTFHVTVYSPEKKLRLFNKQYDKFI